MEYSFVEDAICVALMAVAFVATFVFLAAYF